MDPGQITAAEVVRRARSAVGFKCAYQLGRGGMNPLARYPWSSDRACDCSGFAAWTLRLSRKTDSPWYRKTNGGWLETTAIVRDCATPFGLFDGVAWFAARPGDLVVYGDHDGHQGHVGVVVEVTPNLGPTRVVHCSLGNWHRVGDAIQETGPEIWQNARGIVARCALVVPGESAAA